VVFVLTINLAFAPTFTFSHTFTFNPLTCPAASAPEEVCVEAMSFFTFLYLYLYLIPLPLPSMPAAPAEEEEEVCVELVFGGVEYGALERAGRLAGFQAACVRRVVQLGGVAEQRIHNVLLYDGSVHFQFDLLPPPPDAPTGG
jgi:hypothetical protein